MSSAPKPERKLAQLGRDGSVGFLCLRIRKHPHIQVFDDCPHGLVATDGNAQSVEDQLIGWRRVQGGGVDRRRPGSCFQRIIICVKVDLVSGNDVPRPGERDRDLNSEALVATSLKKTAWKDRTRKDFPTPGRGGRYLRR